MARVKDSFDTDVEQLMEVMASVLSNFEKDKVSSVNLITDGYKRDGRPYLIVEFGYEQIDDFIVEALTFHQAFYGTAVLLSAGDQPNRLLVKLG